MENVNDVRKENFMIECVEYLDIGDRKINVGEKFKIISSELLDLEDGDVMRCYNTDEGFGLCDFEIEQCFRVI